MTIWPDNKRIAVMMAFSLGIEAVWTAGDDGNHGHITNLSRGAHGLRQGIPRILDILDVYGVKATLFTPGVTAKHYPLVVKGTNHRGHEIGFHGYLHKESTVVSYEEEDTTMICCEIIIEDLTGQSIVGHHGPGDVVHDYSLRLLLEHGYLYSSSWRDSDGPFIHTIDGRQVPLVELPKDSIFGDTVYDFHTNSAPEQYELKSPRETLEIWKDEFDSLIAEGRVINFALHPQFIGRVSRANTLSELIGYVLSHGAQININRAVAEYMLENRDLLRPDR